MREENFEQSLFKTADKMRKNIDAAEYKHVVLGLIFLKYISDSFEELYNKLLKGEGEYDGANPEDRDEYLSEGVFFVPPSSRWSYLQTRAKLPSIGTDIDSAMEAIEKENKELSGILPMVFANQNLDKATLGSLVDLISNIRVGDEDAKSKDVIGRVYEYFLGQFADQEGKRGGQFYTPKSIVELMVRMIEPYKGRVYDPACGSGGMFIMSEKFIKEHSGKIEDISIYGQESNRTTFKLCRMNLAIRGVDGSQVKWNSEGSFLSDLHKDLKSDFILANPPFNQSDWGGDILASDARWQYGVPPTGNANFAWMQHMIYHLAPKGSMALVLANGSLSSNTSNEGEIRKNIIEAGLIDCIVALPKQLFYNTGIPACLWFISRKTEKINDKKTLFIDASEMGRLEDRVHRVFNENDIDKISETYHNWKTGNKDYKDVKGYCKSAAMEEIQKHNFILTPGRYVGTPDEEDDGIPFADKMKELTRELKEQMDKEAEMNEEIKKQLGKVGFKI